MAFWLATQRDGQYSDWIKRFDPRFWSVNFPRPMMASVVSTGPESLRVDCEFLRKNDLAGLIWDSVDTLDHPLLAYETQRDYSHCILSFRWRSQGLVALDQPHGPTLTIEGADSTGHKRSWYVRLWNYASGSPQDATIELPFSCLRAGYDGSGETVDVHAIDRMFISLVPQGYDPASLETLPSRVNGWVELSEIDCQGDRAMLSTGAVMLPAHGERMATAYDDSFNQTPARLIRTIEGLGYRGRIVHYVGMSHYYRIRSDRMEIQYSGELCAPAAAWHLDFFQRAIAAEFEPIISLSYEVLAQNCPNWWQQRTHDGTFARTGWDPPSALLSPVNPNVMNFLASIARQFVALLEDAGGRVLFQIGEPWWWVMPDTFAPCLYDAQAKLAWGADRAIISDMRRPMDASQIALLEKAGAALAASTADLAQAVRDAAQGPAEILLLAFTPTVLDEAMPELHRANLPTGWRYPAFDRLQLEDYDWLVQGADGARRRGLEFATEKLGYPVDRQDYFAGFVLEPEKSDTFWPRIDRALDEAAKRGVADRYVWALPQVCRDGYTRFPLARDDTMQAFDDVSYPLALGRDASVSPEFSTIVAVTASGHERRNALWSDARMRYDVGPGIRSEKELVVLLEFFRARFGPARGFRLRDPYDHRSCHADEEPAATDQLIATGDGLRDTFVLSKTYHTQIRSITRPVPGSIRIAVDGKAATGWTHLGSGKIRFDSPPVMGAAVSAGFLFDVPVRFAEDRLDISGVSFAAGEVPSVPLVEIREVA
ncbi:TIGR02217 family protein [Erythrobacter litoralis]|uniref:DUF2460 domain-containing protein n=1 Tax=Erythrobacter litoralis TaxID=39960 RepID=UPI002436000F|nr:DUF2460 domain-containing protein [Erythrobacter litoralis]MDG6079188.1 TIGR02217 family protein [Erythrobacter litoralis]